MEVIPAIDLKDGRCVRLTRGEYDLIDDYGADAVSFAIRWADEGARRLHIVDLDGAKSGSPDARNLAAVRAILRKVPVPVQFGGGLRTLGGITRLLELGVERAILGTSAAVDMELVREAASEYGERVVVGIDARRGRIALRGWTDQTERFAAEFAREVESAGIRRIVFTDIGRDGTLEGPNLSALQEVAGSVSIPVVASGGVGSLAHLHQLATSAPRNVDSVIVGKALYAGTLALSEAIRVAAGAVRR